MVERTVRSPVGDDVILLDDRDFAKLLGLEPGSKAFGQSMKLSPGRLAMLAVLWQRGEVTDRQSGRVTSILWEHARKLDERATNPGHILFAPPVLACVEREVNGKRTYRVRLVALPERWLPKIEQLLGQHAETAEAGRRKLQRLIEPARGAEAEAEVESPTDDVTIASPDSASALPSPPMPPNELTNAVATALLSQVVEVISRGASAPTTARLENDLAALSDRLGSQLDYSDKLRHDLRAASDLVDALKSERDGLRQRLRDVEHNLKVATSADAAAVIDAELRRQTDKLMRQTPTRQHDLDHAEAR